jgi:hypothetical protein
MLVKTGSNIKQGCCGYTVTALFLALLLFLMIYF